MMATRRTTLRVEELGSRVLPSAAPAAGLLPMVSARIVTSTGQQTLAGQGQGTYAVRFAVPDAGTNYDLHGAAVLGGVGAVAVSGSVHSVGFVLHGTAGGTLTFSNARGTVTVALTGPTQNGFASLPQDFHYRVVGGTGAYQHLTGQGTLHLTLHALPSGTGPAHGTFTLTARPG
jgi:hypothetical protein